MRKLGISIYPDRSCKQEMLHYIDEAGKLGFRRIFSCLLSADGTKEKVIAEFKEINTFAKERGFEIILDVAPSTFEKLGASYNDLTLFGEMAADGIRLDLGFRGSEEAFMTFNPQNLKIELNMSNDTNYLDNIMDYCPNRYNLIGCHNFYPHRFTGLSLPHFKRTTSRFRKYGLVTSAFIGSKNQDTFGPWAVSEGLVTLEQHRNLPIHVQAKHYVAMDDIDNIIISNCYPTKEEMSALGKVNLTMLNLEVGFTESAKELERKIILDEVHFNRGDVSEYVIRSTMPRVKYKGSQFPIHNASQKIRRGDVVIESSEYGHYSGEVQIALKDMENSGKSNIVGRITEEEIFLLDYIRPWQKFVFTGA